MQSMKTRTGAAGFTIVELLVVIGIIGILVALLIPAISGVQNSGKKLKTQATMTSISSGLEAYRNATGEPYPPSSSDATGETARALAGADLLGASGFKDVNRDGSWWDGTHSIQDCNQGFNGLYSLDGNQCGDNTLEPLHRRFGPYIDVSKTPIVTMEEYAEDVLLPKNAPNQSIPLPPSSGNWGSVDEYLPQLFILDGFGFPILYYKASVGASGMMVDWSDPNDPGSGIYSAADNALYTGMVVNGNNYIPNGGMDLGAGKNHPLRLANAPNANPNTDSWSDADWRGTFASLIWDRKVTARNVPVNKDSYLLISPGEDALWGTDDDLTNFSK
jgi:prepilin-type N-terminal cleavage/methylation domain-containing protein